MEQNYVLATNIFILYLFCVNCVSGQQSDLEATKDISTVIRYQPASPSVFQGQPIYVNRPVSFFPNFRPLSPIQFQPVHFQETYDDMAFIQQRPQKNFDALNAGMEDPRKQPMMIRLGNNNFWVLPLKQKTTENRPIQVVQKVRPQVYIPQQAIEPVPITGNFRPQGSKKPLSLAGYMLLGLLGLGNGDSSESSDDYFDKTTESTIEGNIIGNTKTTTDIYSGLYGGDNFITTPSEDVTVGTTNKRRRTKATTTEAETDDGITEVDILDPSKEEILKKPPKTIISQEDTDLVKAYREAVNDTSAANKTGVNELNPDAERITGRKTIPGISPRRRAGKARLHIGHRSGFSHVRDFPDLCSIHEVTGYCGVRCWNNYKKAIRWRKEYNMKKCMVYCVAILKDDCGKRENESDANQRLFNRKRLSKVKSYGTYKGVSNGIRSEEKEEEAKVDVDSDTRIADLPDEPTVSGRAWK